MDDDALGFEVAIERRIAAGKGLGQADIGLEPGRARL
jgi:hypothetical protein